MASNLVSGDTNGIPDVFVGDRLRFQLDDNDDLGADTILFYSGDYGELPFRPRLEIQYYLP